MKASDSIHTLDDPRVTRLQVERYRQMTDEERLAIGLRMWEFARDFIACSIRNENPTMDPAELSRRVAERMQG